MYKSLFNFIYLGSVIGDMAKESYRNLMLASVTVGFVCSIVFYVLVINSSLTSLRTDKLALNRHAEKTLNLRGFFKILNACMIFSSSFWFLK